MNYFWVNQGKTFDIAYKFQCLWAPILDLNGKSLHHWDTMKLLQPGDVILNYSQKQILGYCVAQTKSYQYQKPEQFNGVLNWGDDGLICDVKYYLFEKPIDKTFVYEKVKNLLSDKYSPFTKTGEVNQGYLYKISKFEFDAILEIANAKYEILNNEIESEDAPIESETLALGKRRIGQGKYRRDVIKLWGGKCAITGSSVQELLIASHIVPWREGNSQERRDEHNSILLSALYDKLFDKYLISFDDSGMILISSKISELERRLLGLNLGIRIMLLSDKMRVYMNQHREAFNMLN
jgi:putative restriction endonuclease